VLSSATTVATKHAVILSGGGAKGAFEIGILKALLHGRAGMATGGEPIEPVVYTGTSVGAFNAAYLGSQPGQSAARTLEALEAIWRDTIASMGARENGVLRFRGNPLDFLNPSRFLDDPLHPVKRLMEDGSFLTRDLIERTEWFYKSSQRLPRRLLELIDFSVFVATDRLQELVGKHIDLGRVRANRTQAVIVAATNWEQGDVQLFGNVPATGDFEGLVELSDKIGHLAILASTAIPGIFPPVEINHTKYVDGGLLLNTPLAPSLSALRVVAPDDEHVVHVIYLDPDLSDVPLDTRNNTLDTLNRFSALSFASQVNRDIKNAKHVNQSIEVLKSLESRNDPASERIKESFASFLRPEYRPVTIHRYHPSSMLGGVFGLLSFDADNVGSLVEQGFNEARNHDCKQSGCIFPSMDHPMVNRRPA
jgi:NTE family protein